ncbi:TIGR02678 family protein [Nocardiopsis tropica]|uniref:TIGR02678 family protein n=1 Tax=Nocardiopsis tropica TaxID=109330 RepID=A0ABU7KI19_9ACTN|nr:TIGR02678 family protein [Nocardiopsis umidischolae]MEE2048945.1 TIGR02678 family protein [Nocardiopsis umidischolae]
MVGSAAHDLDRARLHRAARALLRRPLLRATGDDADFRLVREHAARLRTWFDRNTGWTLHVDAETVRLRKVPGNPHDPTHPAREEGRGRLVFDRRRYVLLCLSLAVLERAEAQIALGRLSEQVILEAAAPEFEDIAFTLATRDERLDLVAVVRLLLRLGVLGRVAGDEDAFVRSTGDALYDVDRRVLAGMLAGARGPSTITDTDPGDRLRILAEDSVAHHLDSDDLRNTAIRHRLTRRLLDDPVLYHDELTDEERAYLTSQRGAITRRITELTGLVPEARAEGVAMVDPDDDLTDVRMPEQGTQGHATLLLAEHLAAAQGPVTVDDLCARVRELAGEHASYWSKSARTPGNEPELVAQALERLRALGLVEPAAVHGSPAVVGRPALARYAVTAPVVTSPQGGTP